MRWEQLFGDLEGQWAAAEQAELDAEVADRTRREQALIGLDDRLRAAPGRALTLLVEGAGGVPGVLVDTGPDWLLLAGANGREVLVPRDRLLAVTGLDRWTEAPGTEGEVARRLDLRWALRGLARDRSAVHVVLRDGTRLEGTLDRVGQDHVELAEHPAGEARRAAAVRQVRVVPLAALAVLVSVV